MRAATSLLVALLCRVSLALDGGNSGQYVAANCTESSQSPAYWRIDDFVLKVINWDSGGSVGSFGFKSYFSATNTTVECAVQNVDLAKLGDAGLWSKCNNTTGTEFQFSFADISLTMKETWTCSGSPGIIFNANATGSIMMHGCLNSSIDKGVESDCILMELEMAANDTLSATT
ncbi:hypothetical protein B0T26DRAFT_654680 [Lasiosphaeria miniovina]|uniref:AA1-like domain-containing protein n=1 Tax=Lasiosphaeria miniovina TaxID=1954250 RepID=A0AA40DNH1_9PEZI|nr:uncharacterized protein B0T26DRAFT_654680 [Lasiosphaeria miniovina]KAK0706323.1 hypothetical protein B0T26DRAFT_654680 [Lasiosphaeria miniovina]